MSKRFELNFDFSNKNPSGGGSTEDPIDPNEQYPNSPLKGFLSTEPYQEPLVTTSNENFNAYLNWSNGTIGLDGDIYFLPCSSYNSNYAPNGYGLKINTTDDTFSLFPNIISPAIVPETNLFTGGLLLENGKMFSPVRNTVTTGSVRNAYIFDPQTNTYESSIATTKVVGNWYSFIKVKNKIWGMPFSGSNIAMYDLEQNTYELIPYHTTNPNFYSSILHFDGLIYALKGYRVNSIDVFDPETKTIVDNFAESIIPGYYITSAILHPNGKIYALVDNASTPIYEIDVILKTVTPMDIDYGTLIKGTGELVLAPNNKLYIINRTMPAKGSSYISREIDLETQTMKYICEIPAGDNTSSFGLSKPVMHPNGKIYMTVATATYYFKAYGPVMCIDTGCPAKNPSVFLSDYMQKIT